MKKWIVGSVCVMLFGIGAFVADLWINFGLPFGYYGELNRLTAAMEALPNVTVEKVGFNPDVTLEEITIWIREDAHPGIRRVSFSQIDPIRDLWGEKLEAALIVRLDE